MIRVRGSKNIVGHIASKVATLITPRRRVGDATDFAHEFLRRKITTRVGVTLDVVIATSPVPVRVPRDASAVDTIEIGALSACTSARTPLVVVQVPS